MILKDYQLNAVEFGLKRKRGIIILPPGAGKTLTALEIVRQLDVPTVVFCPKSLVGQWEKQIGKLPIAVIPISQVHNLRELETGMIVVDEAKPLKNRFLKICCGFRPSVS